jgi:large subunit ribosomal protein L4
MMAKIYNTNGEIVGETELPSEIFDVKFNPDLVHQVIISQMANKRKPIANTKTREEVSGSGRKIWPQKHLGRARHGDIRAPIFRHGGVAHGPRKDKIYKVKIPKKMKRKALFMVLSQKVRDNELILLDDLKVDQPKTKLMTKIIQNLREKIENFKKGSVLIAIPKKDQNLILAARNIPKVGILEARNLNCLELLNYKFLLMPKESLEKIKETFLKNER